MRRTSNGHQTRPIQPAAPRAFPSFHSSAAFPVSANFCSPAPMPTSESQSFSHRKPSALLVYGPGTAQNYSTVYAPQCTLAAYFPPPVYARFPCPYPRPIAVSPPLPAWQVVRPAWRSNNVLPIVNADPQRRVESAAGQGPSPPAPNQPAPITALTESRINNGQPEINEEEKEESLRGTPRNSAARRIVGGSAYRRRNVYKSIIRHTFAYVRKNREDIISILQAGGFSMSEIEHAFFKINYYNDEERQAGGRKRSQNIVRNIVAKKSIYVYILCEALNAMLKRWEQGAYGKVTRKNATIYKDVCKKYYDETVRVLGRPAQGKSFLL